MIPPVFWAGEDEWREVHQSLGLLFRRYGPAMNPVREAARAVEDGLLSLFPLFDEFCVVVCPVCKVVCCLEARVAFDFRDLLLLHALGLEIPPHQLRRHDNEHCRYLGPEGCNLDRIRRPFVCTWYYCAPMLELFRLLPPREQRRRSAQMAEIQQWRKAMEEGFIRVVTEGPAAAGYL